MNMDLRICRIKAELKYKNISIEYFIKCFDLLNSLINFNHIQGALSFAYTLKDASIIFKSKDEQKDYFKYYNNLQEIINNLEEKLQNKIIKFR